MAATFGSSSINTFLAPVLSAASIIALFSTSVIFEGQQIKTLGRVNRLFALTLLI